MIKDHFSGVDRAVIVVLSSGGKFGAGTFSGTMALVHDGEHRWFTLTVHGENREAEFPLLRTESVALANQVFGIRVFRWNGESRPSSVTPAEHYL